MSLENNVRIRSNPAEVKRKAEEPLTAATVTDKPARQSTNLTAACFTPLSVFERMLDREYTQLRVFCLILVETLGAWPKPKHAAEIQINRFADVIGVTREWVLNALEQLERSQDIEIGKSPRGATCYSIRKEYIEEVKHAGERRVRGRCPDCHTVGLFSTEFIPMAFAMFRKLGGCVDSATFRAVMVICRYTLKWNKEARILEVQPQELDLNDFTRMTGLEKREVMNGIKKALEFQLIGRTRRPGQPAIFWAIPENFGALERRAAREVTPSLSGVKGTAKDNDFEKDSNANESSKTSANESRPWFYAKCVNCGHFVDVEPVTEQDFIAATKPEPEKERDRPPRAGPKREKKSKQDASWEALKDWHVNKTGS